MAATRGDGDFIQSLMKPSLEPGKYAGWIAAPKVGIDDKPGDFEYVQIAAWPSTFYARRTSALRAFPLRRLTP